MTKIDQVLSNDELLEVFASKKGSGDYNALDVMQWAQEAVLAKLHEQEPVATIQVDSVNEVGITYHQFQGLYDGMKLYAVPKEHHRSTKNHIPDAGKMVAPHGYRLVSLADIDTAIQRASVFDDGGDGADPESARSCIEILKSMISSKAVDSLEPRKEVVHDRHTGRELLYIPPVGESLYSMAQARKESFSLALSVDTKEVQALLQSYLDSLEGWQLVPVEPIEEMLKKVFPEIFDMDGMSKNDLIKRYQAMLAEAPKYTGDSNE